ncbi:proprotein convertase subtilisin/kexin type 5-like [Sphaeramia orbicularis]|uniref:proprotein convertase subtilisin/kexin type 5-like n=1 Tax=Sphaeramia orbicularis TaxID=375764 RepID=UPI00117F8D03|nr:proprotein convertase subtilisin/kexin type 5-like [Sphaeramia orbicularis]
MSKHGQCHLCDATCEQCSGPEREECTRCPATRFFDDGRCDIRCQKGRYTLGKQCHLCHHTCQECTDAGPDNCTSCDKDMLGVSRYLFEGQCREACPEGFFHSAWKRCEPCPADCLVCTAVFHCLRCSAGHMLRKGQCVPLECSTGETADAEKKDCLPCDEGCKQCKHRGTHHEDGTVCLKCEDSYYQLESDCYQSCPDQTYSVDEKMVCAPCEDKHCVNCDATQCYLCEEGFYVYDGVCVDHCKQGFFVDEESQDCEPCHRACKTCGGPRFDDCDSCEEGFTLKKGECLEARQLELCPEKHFRNRKGECKLCHSTCKTCSDAGKEDCLSCHSGHFLTAQQTCVTRCRPGTFANKASGQCDDCSRGCVVCQDAQHCQKCRKGLYLQDDKCVTSCQRGFPQGVVCQPCVPQCASCQGNASHCMSCDEQYFLVDHSCRSQCPEGYYTSDKECHSCPEDCLECTEDGLCQKCADYYFLHKDKCVDDCPIGFFPDEMQQECVRCHRDCASCDGPDDDDCDVCSNPKAVRYNGECLANCPTWTYYDKSTNECRDCDKTCLTCSDQEPSSCLTCGQNRTKDASGHCVWYSECSLRSYMDQNGECQTCPKSCHRCFGSGEDHCLSCEEPRFLLNNTCVLECPVGYYAEDKDERVCERCHFSCKSCRGRHSTECVACKPGLFQQGKSCVETCSESHFGNTSTLTCDRCDPSCKMCWGRSNRNCLKCREDYYYLRQKAQCLQSCPAGYYPNSQEKTCHKCHSSCKTCDGMGALSCLTCYEGYTFSGYKSGICISQCFVGFYAVSQDSKSQSTNPICKPCDPSCVDCLGPSKWNCTVCPASQILTDDGRCLSCCGNETLRDGELLPWHCCKCHISEEECFLGENFTLRDDFEGQFSSVRVFVTVCVLLIICIGAGVFVFLNTRLKTIIPNKTKAGGYVKLGANGVAASQPPATSSSSFGDYSDRITACEDDEEEEDEEDDIVYMAQDGTVYRKFKYGLLDDEEVDLEYDDESYSYR